MLVAEPAADSRLRGLSARALSEWLVTVAECDLLHTDILEAHRLVEVDPALIDEWERAALVVRLPFGTVRMLALKSLWERDHAA